MGRAAVVNGGSAVEKKIEKLDEVKGGWRMRQKVSGNHENRIQKTVKTTFVEHSGAMRKAWV